MELVKLNVDGCSKGNPGFAGAGGVLRDSLGSWIKGFAINTVFAFQLKWSCGHRSQDWNLLDHCVYNFLLGKSGKKTTWGNPNGFV
uniref:RNase H type-1 domain-containing protein n=1 Tax=Populus trichocarpa TaxID=3694 RepID=A0A3N7G499_POPTR